MVPRLSLQKVEMDISESDSDLAQDVKSSGSEEQTQADCWKQEGNDAFQKGRYEIAAELYSRAIDLLSGQDTVSSVQKEQLHILYSNRCNTYSKLDRVLDALADANKCIAHAPPSRAVFAIGESASGVAWPLAEGRRLHSWRNSGCAFSRAGCTASTAARELGTSEIMLKGGMPMAARIVQPLWSWTMCLRVADVLP